MLGFLYDRKTRAKQPLFRIKCHCSGMMRHMLTNQLGRVQVQTYQCDLCRDIVSVTRETRLQLRRL